MELGKLDGIAVTHGPGLAGSLLVGVNTAKGLALSEDLPFIGVNHLEGHIYAAWLEDVDPEVSPGFPLLCLITSGGHTDLTLMDGHGRFTLVGRTPGRRRRRGLRQGRQGVGSRVSRRPGHPGGCRFQHRRRARLSQAPRQGLPGLQLQRPEDGGPAQGPGEGNVPTAPKKGSWIPRRSPTWRPPFRRR